MAKFEKGNPGKPKGAKNKFTKNVREIVFEVFERMQDEPKVNLFAWGKENPTEFYKIASKLIPTEVKGEVENTGIIRVVRE